MSSYVDITKEEKRCAEWLAIAFIINYPEDSDSKIVAKIMAGTKGRADPTYIKYFVKAIREIDVEKIFVMGVAKALCDR